MNKKFVKQNNFNIGQQFFTDAKKSSLTKFDLILLDAYYDNIIYNTNFDNPTIYNLYESFNEQSQDLIKKNKFLMSLTNNKQNETISNKKIIPFLKPNLKVKKNFNNKNSINSNDADKNFTSTYCSFSNDLIYFDKNINKMFKMLDNKIEKKLNIKCEKNKNKIL